MVTIGLQVLLLFVLAIPVACVAWTVTHEEVFREPRDYCAGQSKNGPLLKRKFFYLFTCEYCFSHYVTAVFLLITDYHLVYPGWRGLLIAFFSIVWVANIYMGFYARVRVDIKKDRVIIEEKEIANKEAKEHIGQ